MTAHNRPGPGVSLICTACALIAFALPIVAAISGWRWAAAGALVGVNYWLGVPMAAIGMVLVGALSGGCWGLALRVPARAAASIAPAVLLFVIPLFFAAPLLYPWATHQRQEEPGPPTSPFFAPGWVAARTGLYFILWIALARQATHAEADHKSLRVPGGEPGAAFALIALLLTLTFAAYDWIGSITPGWYSTIWGLSYTIGSVLTGMCVLTGIVAWRARGLPLSESHRVVLNDLANLIVTLIALHAYMAFSQFFLIWNGNLTREISWYTPRTQAPWRWMIGAIALFHFALPLFALLFRRVKRSPRALLAVICVVLAARWADTAWMILPSLDSPLTLFPLRQQLLAVVASLASTLLLGAACLPVILARSARPGAGADELLPPGARSYNA